MQKKVLTTMLAILIVAMCAFTMFACDKDTDAEFVMPIGSRPNYDSLFSSEDNALIQKALNNTATDEEMKSAVMALYNTANNSRLNTAKSLVVQESDAGSGMGTILMHAFNLRSGDKWYYQLATQVSTGNEALNSIMSEFAGFLKIGYTNGDGNYYYFNDIGAAYNCDCSVSTFPYASFTVPEDATLFEDAMTLDKFNDTLNVLVGIHEINNMAFCAEIIADGATVQRLEDDGNAYYRVEFSVDVNADKDLVNNWFAMAKKDMAAGGQTLKSYKYYNAVLEVWDNGYAKSFESHSSRDAGALASGDPVDKFSYIWDEEEIIALVKEDKVFEDLDGDVVFESIDDCLAYYTDKDNIKVVPKQLGVFEIAGIVIGCIVAVIIAIVVTIEVLVKKGKLPKLAARREAKKQKRIAKKNAKKGIVDTAEADENNEGEDCALNEEGEETIENDDREESVADEIHCEDDTDDDESENGDWVDEMIDDEVILDD